MKDKDFRLRAYSYNKSFTFSNTSFNSYAFVHE